MDSYTAQRQDANQPRAGLRQTIREVAVEREIRRLTPSGAAPEGFGPGRRPGGTRGQASVSNDLLGCISLLAPSLAIISSIAGTESSDNRIAIRR